MLILDCRRKGVFRVVKFALMLICTAPLADAAGAPLQYTGVNIAGGEFNAENTPGEYGRDYIYPDSATVTFFATKRMNIIRVPVLWERLQRQAEGNLDAEEMLRLDTVINLAASKGMRTIIDVHNYASYRGSVIGTKDLSTVALADLWRRIAQRYKDNALVVFGLMNEPTGLATETWLEAVNIAIAQIRGTGARNLILVPGNGWSSARDWLSNIYGTPNSEVMLKVEDPADNFAYDVHQYFNSDFTGSSADCQSVDIGISTLTPVTEWARQHGKHAFLGEIGVGPGRTCLDALDRVMQFMAENNDVWLGWTYWAGGTWWPKNYFTNIQPLDGKDRPQMAVLEKYTSSN
jgi:endoglucanase